jgi:peptidoglycan/LPS O-acetylase OafA/YrhL
VAQIVHEKQVGAAEPLLGNQGKMQLSAGTRAFSLWLDAFRWIAALIVTVCHACGVMIVNYTRAIHHSLFHLGLSFVAGFAYFAVIVFFVLSGYLVGGSFWSSCTQGHPSITHYLIKRIVRLWIVFIPGMLVTWACIKLAVLILPLDGNGIPGADMISALSISTAFCNAAFLQYAACPPYGGSVPLWSLAHEFWYYVGFPFILIGIFFSANKLKGILFALFGVAILGLITRFNSWHAPIFLYFLLWLLGVAAAVVRWPLIRSPVVAGVLFIITAIALRSAPVIFHYPATAGQFDNGVNYFFPYDCLVAMAFANLLLSLRHSRTLPMPPGGWINKSLAGFSFSLYCIHFPVMFVVASTSMRIFGVGDHYDGGDAVSAFLVGCGVISAVLAAFLFSRMTEAQTDRVRQFLYSFVQGEAGRARPGTLFHGDGQEATGKGV